MLTNYNQVVQLISIMNTPNVSQAETELVQLAHVDSQVLPCLHNLLKDSTQEGWVHTIAATFINRLICDQDTQMEIEHASRVVWEILMDLQIDPVFKRSIERSIVLIIDTLEEPYLTAFREKVFALMQQERLRDTLYLFLGCWTIPKIDVNHLIYLYNVALRHTLNRFIDVDRKEIMMAAQFNEIIKTWSIFWEALQRSEQESADKVMFQITEDTRLPRIIFFIYEWLAFPPLFICTSEELSEINVLKNFTAQLHVMLLQKSIQFRKRYANSTAILSSTEKMMMRVMQNLQMVSSDKEQLDKYQCKDLVIAFLKLLRVFLCASPESFTNLWKEIFTQIVVPYIKTDSDQINNFEEFPDQFIALQEDCAEKQTFGILKTEACKLLERMADKSEKIIQDSFIPNFVLKVSFNSLLASMNVLITHNLDCDLVPLETAITIISVFSYSVKSFEEETKELAEHFNIQFLKSQSPIDRAKLYILMGYIFDDIYAHNLQKGSFWVHAALEDMGHPTVIKACLDFMSNVADEYYEDFFLEALISRVYDNKEGALWEALTKMINSQYNKIQESLMLNLVHCIFARLEKQIEVLKTETNPVTVTIINLVQILCTIIQIPGYCATRPHLKDAIWKITDILQLSIRYSFDDEVLAIVLAFIKQEEQIVKAFLNILPQILEIFKREVYASKTCLILLNEFIVKDQSRESLQPILKMINMAMMTYLMELSQKAKKRQIRPIIMGNIMLLFQNFLFTHKDILGDLQIYEISSLALRFVPEKKEEITDKVLVARALNILLLCHTLRPTDFVWERVNSLYKEEIYFSHDIHVLQTIVQSEVFREPEFAMKGLMISILAHIIQMFKHRKEKEKNSKKIRQKFGTDKKSRIKLNRYADYQVELKRMTIPFNTNPSQKRFIELLRKMRNEYYTIFPQIFSQISQEDQQIIKDVENVTQLATGKQRVIYHVKGAKEIMQCLEEEQRSVEKRRMAEDSSEEQEAMKRDRKVLKHENKKKMKKEDKQMRE